jgi:hypothetical protein
MIEVLANAQAAVTDRLRTHGRGMLFAGLLPAATCVVLFFWTVEAYWAAIGFPAGGHLVIGVAMVVGFALTSLAVGRMIRIALDLEAPPSFPRGFAVRVADLRSAFGALAIFVSGAVIAALWAAIDRLLALAFIAPGSTGIALGVDALARAGALLVMFYVAGRLAALIPAFASGDGIALSAAWRATDGHASILFIVGLAVPVAVGLVFFGPALIAIGALPWPSANAFSRIEALVTDTRHGLVFVGPLLFCGFLAWWVFSAAGLACAWQALKDSGAVSAARAH